jgi:hypothetical protein
VVAAVQIPGIESGGDCRGSNRREVVPPPPGRGERGCGVEVVGIRAEGNSVWISAALGRRERGGEKGDASGGVEWLGFG